TEVAGPVAPVLVALDWEVASPERPEVARGLRPTVAAPPWPPAESAMAADVPPKVRTWAPAAAVMSVTAGPPAALVAEASPPGPAPPPTTRASIELAAGPELPERVSEPPQAPLLASESVSPAVLAAPVPPLEPESPEPAPAPTTTAPTPRMAVLEAEAVTSAVPVPPLAPL